MTAPAVLPPEVQERLWLASPGGFSARVLHQAWPPHLRLVSQMYVLWAMGLVPRLTVSLHPGAAKTQAVSRVGTAWWLNRRPEQKVVVASYGADLAVESGKATRELLEANRDLDGITVRLKDDSSAADRWQTTAGGGMWTMGVGGSLTGRRANKLIVDDPHKDYEDSHSEVQRRRVWNWWRSVALTRVVPGSSVMVVQTRWNEDDLIGHVKQHDTAGSWVHLVLPAIAEQDETIDSVLGEETAARLRAAGVPLPTWHRAQGEALWPVLHDPFTGESQPWYDTTELAAIRLDVGEYLWNGLYMGRPAPPEGDMFPVARWEFCDLVPRTARLVRRWDLAATPDGGDQTASALVGRDHDGLTYVVDVVAERLAAHDTKRLMRQKAEEDAHRFGRARVHTVVEQEPGASGKIVAQDLIRDTLAGFSAESRPSSGKKEVRALPLAAQQQAGYVFVVRQQQPDGSFALPDWWEHTQHEFRQFPNGAHDDIVDVVSAAYLDLAMRRPSRARAKSAAGRSVAGGALGSGASRVPSRAGRAR